MIPLITAAIGALSALSSIVSLGNASPPATAAEPSAAGASGPTFSDALNAALSRVDNAIASATDKAKAFASGSSDVSLSDVMVSLEQANLALQTAANVRDKIVAAYTNVMNMQV